MRLLRCSDTGDFSLTQFRDEAIPPYAILSHTWGADTEEVTFDDLINDRGKDKPGYNKIRFCGRQARQDGLQYFWIDTCCINKANKAELSQSINSMFRWYRNAARCYVYLSDVSITKRKADNEFVECTWEQAFRESRWFTRGWTLQELLAPSLVIFFSREGKRLGDKSSLSQQIYEITVVPKLALKGAPLSQFSIKRRLSWIETRQTKVEEDKAYSLLGIFDVEIPLRYGEGSVSAFRRLEEEINKLNECLQDLRLTDPQDDKKRIEDAKGGLLEDSYRWILENSDFQQWRDDTEQSQLLWIKGDPGKGKTMLLCGIIDELNKSIPKTTTLSYFFCQATDVKFNNATAVLRGLLYLLINQQPSLVSYIRKKHDHAGKALFEDVNAWVALSDLFTSILQDPSLSSTYLIVDALDECLTDLPKLLDLIVRNSNVSSRVKWIVSSRNWPIIEKNLNSTAQKVKLCLELNEKSVSRAIGAYIQFKVDWLAERNRYDNNTRDAVKRYLSLNAKGTFLWVALVCQELANISGWKAQKKLTAFPPGLNALYRRMMDQIRDSEDADLCGYILAIVSVIYRPVTLDELESFVDMPNGVSGNDEALSEVIEVCGSFLTLRERTVSFVHQSAKDFLFKEASHELFPSGIEDIHYLIFSRSLQAMSKPLRRDMYSLRALGYPTNQVEPPDPDPLATARYSCIYWIDHLCDWCLGSSATSSVDLQDGGAVHEFIRKKYLYWLEALSLCKSMSRGVVSMAKLEMLVQRRTDASALNELVRDARRFIMSYKWAIENSPLQAYASALLFSPTHSLIRGLFKREEPNWFTIKPAMQDKWSPCLQTLEGHSRDVGSVAFSHDSARLASASYDGTAKIWDTHSGECLSTLEGHSGLVESVAFSHDSAQLVSASGDMTVKIWHAGSGECLQTLEGHSDRITSVAFSHDSARLASGSADETVKIWDASSGECLQTLKGHFDIVNSVAFSHDSAWLASGSFGNTVKLWDASSGECLQTLKMYDAYENFHVVYSVAFSHDSSRLAVGSSCSTVNIWNTSSGECLQALEGCSMSTISVAFSHDSTRLASASKDRTIKLWDVSSGECLQTLEGHSGIVLSVTFSQDSAWLASASADKTVKIWDASGDECLQTRERHGTIIKSVAFSHDSTRLVSASDTTVKIWDAISGECLQTLEGHRNVLTFVAFSYDSAWLVSGSYDRTVKIWDASSGECLQTLEGHSSPVMSIAFSYNSARLASGCRDRAVKIWDTSSGKCLQTLMSYDTFQMWDPVNSVAFSHDSPRLASGSTNGEVNIWDASSGVCLQTLEGHSTMITSVAFSLDSARLASASKDNTVKLWDASRGECLQTISIGTALRHISFNNSSSSLHTDIGTIETRVPPGVLSQLTSSIELQNPQYQGLALSADRIWITYNSENLVWLPAEYRSTISAVSGKRICIGVGRGRVMIYNIQLEILSDLGAIMLR